jgi:hypothetical protein
MVLTPAVRGMFGLEWNAGEGVLTVTPSLPAQWNEAKISGVPVGERRVSVEVQRKGSILTVRLAGEQSQAVKLRTRAPGASAVNGILHIPLPPVEIGIEHGLPEAGSVTSQLKVLDQQKSPRSLQLHLTAPSNSQQILFLRVNDAKIHPRVEGAEVSADSTRLKVSFPAGAGYVEKKVTLSW